MEKLSGILPSSPRVRSVDMDEAPPARPGAPTYGKKVGRNTVTDKVTLSPEAKGLKAPSLTKVQDPKELARSKIADNLTKNFFETRLNKATEPVSTELVAENIASMNEDADPVMEQAIKAYERPNSPEPRMLISAEA